VTAQELLLEVFCLVDDELQGLKLGRIRRRGPMPTLTDAEVITLEIVGEFWKLNTDRDIYRHFRAYHASEFPALARIHRTTFARQAANLMRFKQLIQQRLAEKLAGLDPVWLADSMPIHACQFARAKFCRRFAGLADYGYDHLIKRTFYGFRLHLRATREGVILGYELAPARVNESVLLAELAPPAGSTGIGDRGYGGLPLRESMAESGVKLLAPPRRKCEDRPGDKQRAAALASLRYRIETVNGQQSERFEMKRTWARDIWHLCHRVARKILSHTVMIGLTFRHGFSPLSFDRLLPAA
jgi:Transposase DDE domain